MSRSVLPNLRGDHVASFPQVPYCGGKAWDTKDHQGFKVGKGLVRHKVRKDLTGLRLETKSVDEVEMCHASFLATCFQILPSLTKLMRDWFTLKRFANTDRGAFDAKISDTLASVSFEEPTLSPSAWRFFCTLSLMLSACVPKKRWSGLTHDGLSQLWQTTCPVGIGPRVSSHATLLALRHTFVLYWNQP